MIRYTEEMNCSKKELQNLYLSVKWNSGKYPEKKKKKKKNSTYKIFAYDGDDLIGLVTGLSDNCINLFISYLLVKPEYHNKKIGSRLLNMITSKKDFNRIQLITEDKDKDFFLELMDHKNEAELVKGSDGFTNIKQEKN